MKFGKMSLGFALMLCMSAIANAGPFGLFNRQPVRNVATVASHTVHGAVHGASHGIAQAKAQQQANEGRMRHVGGSMGAGRYEGVGFSTVSAEDAIRSSCFYGQRTPVDVGVVRGANGWYATVLYR